MAMKDDGYYLLKAIIANPDDDLPRLVYADYLDEHQQGERASFIRCQCSTPKTLYWWWDLPFLYNTNQPYGDVLVMPPQYPSDQIGVRGHSENDTCRHAYRRGFIEQVHCNIAQFERHAGRIAAEHPVEKWVIMDYSPMGCSTISDPKEFPARWYRLESDDLWIYRYQLPADLWDALDQYAIEGRSNSEGRWKQWNTDANAMLALARAAYALARQRAEALENRPDLVIVDDPYFPDPRLAAQ